METLKINKENAILAYEQANDKGKTLLSNLFGKEVFAKLRFKSYKDIQTFKDAVEYLGDEDEFVKEYIAAHALVPNDVKAYFKLRIIVKAINDGKVMDYANTSEVKYYPWFNPVGSNSGFSCDDDYYGNSNSYVGSRLCYLSSDRAVYAGKQFLDIYNSYIN